MILTILKQIESTTKGTEKLKILTENKDNSLLQRVFLLTYDPKSKFNIKKIPEYTTSDSAYITLDDALDIIEQKFIKDKIRGHAAIDILAKTLSLLKPNDAIVLERVIKGDLRMGCSVSTINKVWKNLITDQPCQLATAYSEAAVKHIFDQGMAYAQLKADGARCMAICHANNEVDMVSRNGKPFIGLHKIERWLVQAGFQGFVIDGELEYHPKKESLLDFTDITVANTNEAAKREISNGIINKASNGTISNEEQLNVIFKVWDIIPIDVYFGISNELNAPYGMRLSLLRTTLAKTFYGIENPPIQIIETHNVMNIDETRKIYNDYVSRGYEGIVLKSINSLWENKRSKELVKFKEIKFADLRIVEIIEGTGKLAGKMGTMRIVSDDGMIDCYCGIGLADKKSLTDSVREHMYNNQELYIDTIAEFAYNSLTKNKDSKTYSLFLPRYSKQRPDKNKTNEWDQMQ